MEDSRSLLQQRDEIVLTKVFLQLTSEFGVSLSLRSLSELIERLVGVKLWCSDQMETRDRQAGAAESS